MREKRYCVFWYPTIYQRDVRPLSTYTVNWVRDNKKVQLQEIENEASRTGKYSLHSVIGIEDKDISDDSNNPYYLMIALNRKGDLYVFSKLEKKIEETGIIERESFLIKLTYEDFHQDGLVEYSFFLDEIPEKHRAKFENSVLARDVYHLSKRFYHRHEAEENKDCSLSAYISKRHIGIDKVDNICLKRLLTRFTKVLESYVEDISFTNQEVLAIEKGIEDCKEAGIDISEKQYKNLLTQINTIVQKNKNASLEYTYAQTLIYSENNQSFKYFEASNMDSLSVSQKKSRRSILNIFNSMRYIDSIKYINQNRFNQFSIYKFEVVEQLQNEARLLQERSDAQLRRLDAALTRVQYAEDFSSLVAWLGVIISSIGGLVSWGFAMEKFLCEKEIEWKEFILGGLIIIVGGVFSGLLIKQKRKRRSRQ